MSNFAIGTLVMLNTKEPPKGYPNEPSNGAIGEVKDAGDFQDTIRVGSVAVLFPHNLSWHPTNFWQYRCDSLIPISGPDIDIGEEEVVKTNKYAEDLV